MEPDNLIPKFIWERLKIVRKTILKIKKEISPDIKTYCKAFITKAVWYWPMPKQVD